MSKEEILISENKTEDLIDIKTSEDLLTEARKKVADLLNIDLTVPRQEKRIEALKVMYKKYSEGTSVDGFIYRKIIDDCDQLIDIYKNKEKMLNEVKILNENFSSLKIRLENINYRYEKKVKDLEESIYFNKKLLGVYENKFLDGSGIDSKYRKRIKELDDICWDNWLKALDVNKELTNTIIGFENRKALLEISKAYIDYYIFVDFEIKKCFSGLRQSKKDGILEYYDFLSRYQLPVDKKVDFKMFLQKKIESKFVDVMEIKTMFGDFSDSQRKQIDDFINEIGSQYERDRKDIITVINHYKKFLLNKQVLFTNESEQLVIYFKRRYIEKIDFLCSRFQVHNVENNSAKRKVTDQNLELLKKFISDEFESQLNRLKIEYSKKFIPFLDNFWHLEQTTGSEYALDEELLNKKMKDLKISKNLGLKGIISEFERDRKKIKDYFDKKLGFVDDISKMSLSEFDKYLKDLKNDCDILCCEIINLNARFWTKANAEFNCEVRKYLINLRHQYAPYVQSWRSDSKPWMNEYLIINFNQELLRAAGEATNGLSPESELYLKTSKELLKFNEKTRKILTSRDKVERDQLINLNTVPKPDISFLKSEANKKLDVLKKIYELFLCEYDSFYNSLLEFDYGVKN